MTADRPRNLGPQEAARAAGFDGRGDVTPLSAQDRRRGLGVLFKSLIAGTTVELLTSCDLGSLAEPNGMPACNNQLGFGVGNEQDCTQIPNINDQVDQEHPGLRRTLTELMTGYATVIGVSPIEFYFHTFDTQPQQDQGTTEFNAQPNILNHIDGSTTVSIHIWVNDPKKIPPKEILQTVAVHEGAHALDRILAYKIPDDDEGIVHTIAVAIDPKVPKEFSTYTTEQGLVMKDSVKGILQEGQYIDATTCDPLWCTAEEKSGHPWANAFEAFASTVTVMIRFKDEFLRRLQTLSLTDSLTTKAIAQYGIDVLNQIEKYGNGTNVLSTLGFASGLRTELAQFVK